MLHRINRFMTTSIFTFGASSLMALTSYSESITKIDDKVQIIAHRGGKALWPENTLFSLKNAANLGVDWLEFDIQSSADGHALVFHDDTLERTTNGVGPISALSLEELRSLDAAYNWTKDDGASFPYRNKEIKIPLLEEVFQALPKMRMLIELKSTGNPQELCRLIQRYQREHLTVVGSFFEEKIAAFKLACPNIAVSAGRTQIKNFYISNLVYLSTLYRPKIHSMQLPIDPEESEGKELVTRRMIRALKKQKIQSHIWTVNTEADMRRMIELGVDGIITDDPILLKKILAEPLNAAK
ncbi:MAG: glycerophosphodiester phosphodiesterase [Oligoflexales bacterium]|nr:glycerophosphodiester phosphodiesterase [Oligoflexales bacterium]